MARPKKNADEALSEVVSTRMKPASFERLQSMAYAANVGTEAEIIRRLIDGAPIIQAHSMKADPALIAALNNYAVALSKIGNNVNQLASATHTGRDFVKYWREVGQQLEDDLSAARFALHDALEGVRE